MRAVRLLVVAALFALGVTASAQAATHVFLGGQGDAAVGIDQKPLPLRIGSKAAARAMIARTLRGQTGALAIGDERIWLALDDAGGYIYLKNYQLRGIGKHIEVWVANDQDEVSTGTQFLPGDCRNDRTEITDDQVQYLIDQFDSNIYPKESEALSVPPGRDGSKSELVEDPSLELPADYYAGDGHKIVVLVDNFRDSNFYNFDLVDESDTTYIAGFYDRGFDDLFDRHVMNIDAFDWFHRTGANPPDNPDPDNLCKSAPGRAFLYEGVFAHEYQHLLERYQNPDQFTWVDEGLADWAAGYTGYLYPAAPITDPRAESGTQCFLGWGSVQTNANPNPRPGGPENSLTVWGDQNDDHLDEILCDYGAAFTFMNFVHDRYGTQFISDLHRGKGGDGLPGVRKLVTQYGSARQAKDIVHDWAAMAALDKYLDGSNVTFNGKAAWYQSETLDASINWDTSDAYAWPGAPPNGSDYVRLRDQSGHYVSSKQIGRVTFDGAATLPAQPVEWSVDQSPPDHPGDAALYSGSGSNFDRAIVHEVAVPADDATLTFETRYDTEPTWDYGFVQISTDGGKTYKSLANDDTDSEPDSGAVPTVKDNLPGFTGQSGGGDTAAWVEESFDLSPYAGKTVLLAFRYVTDSSVDLPGWWIDDVKVGGETVTDGTTLNGWATPTQIKPNRVAGFTVQLVAMTSTGPRHAILSRMHLTRRHGSLNVHQLKRIFGERRYDVVAAIVTYDDPSEYSLQYAPYRLLVVPPGTQPGG